MDLNKIIGFWKRNYKLIFSHTFNYAIILVFPAFGPVLNRIVGVKQGVFFGSVFLFFLIINIFTSPKKFELNQKVVKALVIFSIISIVLFPVVNTITKYIIMAFFGCTTGRYTVFFCHYFMNNAHEDDRIKVLGIILTLSYSILYISNIIVPPMSNFLAVIWSVIILIGSFIFAPTIPIKIIDLKSTLNKESLPIKNLLVVFLIFITAGTTYAGIYPELKQYAVLERFYNVLPFLFAAISSIFIANKKGRKHLIYFGVSSIGLAFVFSFFPSRAITYLLIQSCLQIGWAFLDAYAWYAGTDYAVRHNQPMLIAFFVGAFLSGTFLGSILNIIFESFLLHHDFIGNLLTFFPLFIVFLFIPYVQETLTPKMNKKTDEELLNELFAHLTPREKEVIDLLIKDMKNEEISTRLFISPNTLKKHARNIYKKMEVSNKRELKKLVYEMLNEG